MKLCIDDIESLVGFVISNECKKMINDFDLEYESLDLNERDQVILKVMNHLNTNLISAGDHRLDQWEKGWFENLELLKMGKSVYNLIPKYFGKNKYVRLNGEFFKSDVKDFDYKNLIILIDSYLHEFVGKKYENLFEFGCGPAYHLLRFGNFNKHINLTGLDWTESSQMIIGEISDSKINDKIKSHKFNFFEPDYNIQIPNNTAIFTCNALEQIGENFNEFLEFILDKKPDLCINFEPMTEFLDENILLDKLSILYCQKRNYLKGYFSKLKYLEEIGKIEIILEKRLFFGSLFLESISVVIWKPIK